MIKIRTEDKNFNLLCVGSSQCLEEEPPTCPKERDLVSPQQTSCRWKPSTSHEKTGGLMTHIVQRGTLCSLMEFLLTVINEYIDMKVDLVVEGGRTCRLYLTVVFGHRI